MICRAGEQSWAAGIMTTWLAAVGGEPLPGIGFAMGDVMSTIVLEKYGCIPEELTQQADQVLVTVFDESFLLKSYSLAAELREAGVKAMVYPETAKLQKQLKFADRKGIRYAVILGPDEDANQQVTVKDLAGREQETLDRAVSSPRCCARNLRNNRRYGKILIVLGGCSSMAERRTVDLRTTKKDA
jgi:histidyl-tRNA synthetase